MPERDSYSPGTPCWVELGSSDLDAGVPFYEGLFGWNVAESMPDTGGYRLAMLRDRPVAGLSPLMSDQQPVAWTTYVSTDAADGVAEKVKANGGQVVAEPMDVMELGRMTVFLDPQGAALGAWQPIQFPGAGIVNEAGAFSWSELMTRDLPTAVAFYEAVFGWTEKNGPQSTYKEFEVEGHVVAGGQEIGADMPAQVPPHWNIYFGASDVDATAARAGELGGTVRMPPFDVPDGARRH